MSLKRADLQAPSWWSPGMPSWQVAACADLFEALPAALPTPILLQVIEGESLLLVRLEDDNVPYEFHPPSRDRWARKGRGLASAILPLLIDDDAFTDLSPEVWGIIQHTLRGRRTVGEDVRRWLPHLSPLVSTCIEPLLPVRTQVISRRDQHFANWFRDYGLTAASPIEDVLEPWCGEARTDHVYTRRSEAMIGSWLAMRPLGSVEAADVLEVERALDGLAGGHRAVVDNLASGLAKGLPLLMDDPAREGAILLPHGSDIRSRNFMFWTMQRIWEDPRCFAPRRQPGQTSRDTCLSQRWAQAPASRPYVRDLGLPGFPTTVDGYGYPATLWYPHALSPFSLPGMTSSDIVCVVACAFMAARTFDTERNRDNGEESWWSRSQFVNDLQVLPWGGSPWREAHAAVVGIVQAAVRPDAGREQAPEEVLAAAAVLERMEPPAWVQHAGWDTMPSLEFRPASPKRRGR